MKLRSMAFGAAALFLGVLAYERFWRAPTEEELQRLREARTTLNARLEKRLAGEILLPEAPRAGVIVGVPVRFAERFAGEVATSLLSEMKLTLRDVEVRKAGEVRGRILVGRSRLGGFDLNVHLDEVKAVLRAGRPQMRFGGDRVGVVLPVSLVRGSGRGRLRFRWVGHGVAGAVCGDLEMRGEIAGTAVPAAYTLRGGFGLATDGATLVARPAFDDVEINLQIEPSADSWRLVERVVQEQGAVCRAALRAADVREKVRSAVARGFAVKLPRKLLPEVRLPVEMEQSVAYEGTAIHFHVRPAGLSLTRAQIWYGAEVQLADTPAPASEGVPGELGSVPSSR